MKETLLHYIWKYKKFPFHYLQTIDGKKITIIHWGYYNKNSGPDFSYCKIKIDEITWIGNIEIHVYSSDWLKHKHSEDKNYKNIILHVVYEHDKEVAFIKENNIPVLELKNYLSMDLLDKYKNLEINLFRFIPCEKLIKSTSFRIYPGFYERLYFSKLEEKSNIIKNLLKANNNNWDFIFLRILAYTFGLKVNAQSFEDIITSIDYKVFKKIATSRFSLEALFLGITDIINNYSNSYFQSLQKEYEHLKTKYKLNHSKISIKHLRLRPNNFPLFRLLQLAYLINNQPHLFSLILETNTIKGYEQLLNDTEITNEYIEYSNDGGKNIKKNIKLSKSQKHIIILNTFFPIKFAYYKERNSMISQKVLDICEEIPSEKNSIITQFKSLNFPIHSALATQALLYLYKEYCLKKKCLDCKIGYQIIK